MELEDFEKGDGLIKENQLGSARYHDVAGDFYKHFQDNEMANYHYDLAISFDMDESQKNLIKLKKPLNRMKNFYVITIIFLLSSCQTLSSIQETLGLVEEDPNAPVKLDENYESFLDVKLEKKC